MAQIINVRYHSPVTSASVNEKISDILGKNFIIRGFNVVPNQGALSVNLIIDAETNDSSLIIKGAQITETNNIDNIQIDNNTSGISRTDVIYAHYNHSSEAACEYLVGKGTTTVPANGCKIAEIIVPHGATEILEENIKMEPVMLSLDKITERLRTVIFISPDEPEDDNVLLWIDTLDQT